MSNLVLGRTEGESIVTDGPCMMTVVAVVGKRVKIAFEGTPNDTNIWRGELEDAADLLPADAASDVEPEPVEFVDDVPVEVDDAS